jgi:hypothetical protein
MSEGGIGVRGNVTGERLRKTGSGVIETSTQRMSRSSARLVESGRGRGIVILLYLVEDEVDRADKVELND